jgi:hypothetical protein
VFDGKTEAKYLMRALLFTLQNSVTAKGYKKQQLGFSLKWSSHFMVFGRNETVHPASKIVLRVDL